MQVWFFVGGRIEWDRSLTTQMISRTKILWIRERKKKKEKVYEERKREVVLLPRVEFSGSSKSMAMRGKQICGAET